MNESFIGTDTDLKGSRSAGATLIAKLPPSQIIFEEFRPRQFRFLIKQLTGQHHRRHQSVTFTHMSLCPVSSLVSCSFPALPSCKAHRVCFERPFSRSRWVDTDSLIHTSAMMSDGVGLLSCSSSSFFCFVLTVNRFYLHVLLWQQSILLHQYWLLHSQPAPTKTKKCIFLKSMAADSCFLALSLRPLTVW